VSCGSSPPVEKEIIVTVNQKDKTLQAIVYKRGAQ